MKNELKLISMDTVEAENVQWLWYPYIPPGKITIVHGDPGEGKTTFALAVIASLTKGEPLPECEESMEPMNVIYQTAEDGLADTIKPRLVAAGADCTRVLVIDETNKELTLIDERLEEAIKETGAQLIVLDPIQAYLGEEVDMHRANEVRPVLKRVAAMAERTHCAVLLVGHINKAQGQKSTYRGLGSIDFQTAARSVLVVGRLKENKHIRVVAQDKNSLAPEGSSIAFELNEQTGFCWKGACEATVDDVLNGTGKVQTKTMLMEEELKRMLIGRVPAEEVQKRADAMDISKHTMNIAKKNLSIISEKVGDQWFWKLPEEGCKDVELQRLCTLATFSLCAEIYAVLGHRSRCVRLSRRGRVVAPPVERGDIFAVVVENAEFTAERRISLLEEGASIAFDCSRPPIGGRELPLASPLRAEARTHFIAITEVPY